MEESAAKFPNKEFEAVRALEDGDLVAVHGRVRLTPSSPWIALIHIFGFQDNQIIEEWEVGQEVPKESPNQNGVF
jgi:predicted SnoaL-like aldol condensation-catalyzing enzyme